MQLLKNLQTLSRVHSLIKTKASGTPESMAKRLGLSKRQLYRLLDEMKMLGFPIAYSSERKCYYYTDTVKLDLDLVISEVRLLNIKG